MQLFKYIAQAIQIFLDNVVINSNVLRVGETEGYIDDINQKESFASVFDLDSKQCYQDKKVYNENETWFADQCTTCICRDGLPHCTVVQCPVYEHCGYMYKSEDECCPKCGGYFYIYFY